MEKCAVLKKGAIFLSLPWPCQCLSGAEEVWLTGELETLVLCQVWCSQIAPFRTPQSRCHTSNYEFPAYGTDGQVQKSDWPWSSYLGPKWPVYSK